jgi:hypothetical protein
MAEAWWAVQYVVTFGGRIPVAWAAVAAIALFVACVLAAIGRLSTHSFGPISGFLFVIWYFALLAVVAEPSDESAWSIVMFYPKAFGLLLVLVFILHVRRAELDADQRRRSRQSTETIVDVPMSVPSVVPGESTQREAPKFSLYLRPFVSTNELPVQFDHGRNTIVAERIDLESILRRSLSGTGRFVAVGRSGDDVLGADRIETAVDWRTRVASLSSRAERIFILPSHHEGTLWEIAWLVRNRRVADCIWIMPECVFRPGRKVVVTVFGINWFYSEGNQTAVDKARQEWCLTTAAVTACGVHLPAYREEGLLFKVDETGQVIASEPLDLCGTLRRVRKVRRIIERLGTSAAWSRAV